MALGGFFRAITEGSMSVRSGLFDIEHNHFRNAICKLSIQYSLYLGRVLSSAREMYTVREVTHGERGHIDTRLQERG